jgi:hypothetical protein
LQSELALCYWIISMTVEIVGQVAKALETAAEPKGVVGQSLTRHSAYYNALERRQAAQGEAIRAVYDDPLMSCAETMQILRVSYSLLRSWMKKGLIQSWRSSSRGRHKFRLSEIERIRALKVVE